jgi:hypothetical protein
MKQSTNEQFQQREKELEINNQLTLTKEEMKSINNVFIGKEIQIKEIQKVIESEKLDTYYLRVLTLTEDKRIASGGWDGNISISSYDVTQKIWHRDICE